jgi:hypothetical protein
MMSTSGCDAHNLSLAGPVCLPAYSATHCAWLSCPMGNDEDIEEDCILDKCLK